MQIMAAGSNFFGTLDLLLKTYLPGISYVERKMHIEKWQLLKHLESFPTFFIILLIFLREAEFILSGTAKGVSLCSLVYARKDNSSHSKQGFK